MKVSGKYSRGNTGSSQKPSELRLIRIPSERSGTIQELWEVVLLIIKGLKGVIKQKRSKLCAMLLQRARLGLMGLGCRRIDFG